jgi:hypothetical protein
LAQIGLAESSLRRWVEAYAHLSEALSQTDDEWISHNSGFLNEQLEKVRAHVGLLSIDATPGADVSVNGGAIGKAPLRNAPVTLPEGHATITAALAGYSPRTAELEIRGGTAPTVALDLVPIAKPSVPVVPAVQTGAATAVPAGHTTTPTGAGAGRTVAESPGYRVLPWVAIVAGITSMAASGVVMVSVQCHSDPVYCPNLVYLIAITEGSAIGGAFGVFAPFVDLEKDPGFLKQALLIGSSIAAASAIGSGYLLARDFPDTQWKRDLGFGGVAVGAAALIANAFIAIEPTPSRKKAVKLALSPGVGGVWLHGKF